LAPGASGALVSCLRCCSPAVSTSLVSGPGMHSPFPMCSSG